MKTYEINDLSGGAFYDRSYRVDDFENQECLVTAGKKTYVAKKRITARSLKAGKLVMAHYNQTNQGADIVEVLGFTDDSSKYGEDNDGNYTIAFKSHSEMLKHFGVKSLKALEDKQGENEYGYESYLVVKDVVDGMVYGLYLFNGRWAQGSGAEPTSFIETEPFVKEEYEAAKQEERCQAELGKLQQQAANIDKEIARLRGQQAEIYLTIDGLWLDQ